MDQYQRLGRALSLIAIILAVTAVILHVEEPTSEEFFQLEPVGDDYYILGGHFSVLLNFSANFVESYDHSVTFSSRNFSATLILSFSFTESAYRTLFFHTINNSFNSTLCIAGTFIDNYLNGSLDSVIMTYFEVDSLTNTVSATGFAGEDITIIMSVMKK